MSASSSVAASTASFHFAAAPPAAPGVVASPLHSPISPTDSSSSSPPPPAEQPTSPALHVSAPYPAEVQQDVATPLYTPSQQTARPPLTTRGLSFAGGIGSIDALSDRQRRVSYGGQAVVGSEVRSDDIWGTTPRVARAGSDGELFAGAVAASGNRPNEGDAYEQERAALFREHEQRSLENSARSANTYLPPLPSTSPLPPLSSSFQQQHQLLSALPPLMSPTSPPLQAALGELAAQEAQALQATQEGRFESASLHLGDLDAWMDEAYVRECCARMGWEGVTNIKMIRGASPSSGYCFLTFPSATHAAQVLARFASAPPMLMPRSTRTFKLNWGTGLPGVQPRWEGEYSVFVGDLGREVGESELVSLFTPIFPSTKSAKIMYDPSTGISRGYGFVRFADETDMQRALALGQNAGSGLSLHGRTLRISEASGPGNALDGNTRERSRTRSGEGLTLQNGSATYNPYQQQQELSPGSNYPEFLSPTLPVPYAPPQSQYGQQSMGGNRQMGGGGYGGQQSTPAPHTTDPNNTTVFVGGLPACISEETLKSFFHHFGEITYCKIPTGKGCGFVQFVRRADAELAIAKMNDFPIHGKSRIRLSWGRSQGDKQVEHVRKLASALGVPFEAVWRMVQGQDNTTIKQIATAVGGTPILSGRFESLGVGRMELGAVASAAGLTEAEVLELVGGRASLSESYGGTASSNSGRSESDFFTRSSGLSGSSVSMDASANSSSNGGPYSRVSPSSFSAFAGSRGPTQNLLPLSPPPSAGAFAQNQLQQQQQHQSQLHHYAPPSPYTSIRPDSYLVHSPSSPYERVDFAEGGVPQGARGNDRYQQQSYQPYNRYAGQPVYHDSQQQRQQEQQQLQHQQHQHQQQHAQLQQPYNSNGAFARPPGSLEESFAGLNFSPPPAPTRNDSTASQGQAFAPSPQDFFPGAGGAATSNGSAMKDPSAAYLSPEVNGGAGGTGAAQWGTWNDLQA